MHRPLALPKRPKSTILPNADNLGHRDTETVDITDTKILDMCGQTDTKILDMYGQTGIKILDMCGQTDTKILDD